MSDSEKGRWTVRAEEAGSMREEQGVRLDEFVLDDWLHLEQMDRNEWWLRIGDVRVNVFVEAGGVRVNVVRACYEEATGETKCWDGHDEVPMRLNGNR